MTSFEAGFAKYAEECGLPNQRVAHIFKRAMEHPGAQALFKDLPEEDSSQSPTNLEALTDLLKQHTVHADMDAASKRIQF